MSREIIARVETLDQISPDDFRVRSRTKIFQSTVSIDLIVSWANSIGNYTINDITITQAE